VSGIATPSRTTTTCASRSRFTWWQIPVSRVVALDVALVDVARTEEIGLHAVVDDEIDRDERLDPRRVLARALHRGTHRGEIDRGGDAGVVLEQDP
jgi:hypothetical protein